MAEWIAAGAALLGLAYAVLTYNRLVGLRTRTAQAWASVDVQLRRRQELIPNLVEAARGYLQHERALFDELAETRARAAAAGDDVPARSAAEGRLAAAVDAVVLRAEAFPDLKGSEPMLRLQEDLTSAESRIAMARRHFNDSVLDYNIAVSTFPALVVAGACGLRRRDMFAAADPAAQASGG